MSTIALGSDIPDLLVKIQKGSAQSFGLQVTNLDGTPADLTGSVATIELVDGTVWTATTTADIWQWDLTATDTLVSWTKQPASLVVTTGGVRRTWGTGSAVVRP